MPEPTFTTRRAEIDDLTRHWRVGPAFYAARQLVEAFPGEVDGYTLFNMLIAITNNGGGKDGGIQQASPRLIVRAAENIPRFVGSLAHGDMLRDQLLGFARFPVGQSLAAAAELPDAIAKMHGGDPNRMACLLDAQARLEAANGNLEEAWRLHSVAHQQWGLLGSAANANWVHFNLVHWLRVSIELLGRNHERTRKIVRLLNGDNPPGGHGSRQISIILLPVIGLRTYRWLETHRM